MSDYWNVDAYQKKDVQFQYVVKPSDDETQGATAANQQKNEPVVQGQKKATTDEVKLENKKPTEADNNSRSLAAARNAKAKEEANNNAYGAKLAGTIEDKALKEDVLLMTEAINNREEAKAAVYYEKLQKAGVFTEETGKPPYAEALEKRIQEQKNQKLAEGVVDDMNTDKGMKDVSSTYESTIGLTKKEVKENFKKLGIDDVHGAGKIAKAARKNKQHIEKQLALKNVIVDDGTDRSKLYIFATQDDDYLQFTGTAKDAYKFVKEHSSEIYGKEWDKKAPPAAYMSEKGYAAAEKLNELAKKEGKDFIFDGKIDIAKAQAYAREKVSMAGDRGDQNELKALAGELNVKAKDVKAMLRGINIDYQKDRRWVGHVVGGVLGAGVAATDLATGFMGSQVGKTIETTIAGGKIVETVVQPGVIKKETVKIGPDGKEQRFTEYVTTPGSTTSTSTPGSESTNETPGKRKIGAGDVIKDLALGYTVYDLASKGLNKVLMHDPQILKKGHTLADALDNPDKNYLKKKSNNEVMTAIANTKLEGYTPEEARAIKLQLLEKSMGDSGEKLNRRELLGVLAALKSVPPKATTPTTTTPTTTTPTTTTPPTPTVTERTVLDIGGDGFFNPDANDGKGEFLKDADGKNLGQIGDGDGAVGLKGSIGHARDWEKLKQRGAQTEGNDVKAKAQYVIADEKGETAVTPDSTLSGVAAYEAPFEIKLKDNTNGKDNTYQYKKLSSEEAKQYVPADAGEGPFYILDSAYDANRQLKAKNIEVYRLELKPEEEVVEEKDDKGNITRTKVRRFKYNLEQYKGYRGSKQTSMFWNHRAK